MVETTVRIQENVPLRDYSTFHIGGPARYFVSVTTEAELDTALTLARKSNWPLFILAAGSNVIFPDEGWPGLVILMNVRFLEINAGQLTAGAATMMSQLVDDSIDAGLKGLEWAGGLPGTFGGAIRGNAGCFKGEIKDIVTSVVSLEAATGRKITRPNDGAMFGYRDSIYKRNNEIILQATVQLRPGEQRELRRIADDHIQFRKNRHPLEYPNAGSIFKNVPIERVKEPWLTHFHDFIKIDPFPIVPTGKIIEDAGLKGYQVGDAAVSEKHANYIVNLGNATAQDVKTLIGHIIQVVQEKFQIALEVEPEVVGEKIPSNPSI